MVLAGTDSGGGAHDSCWDWAEQEMGCRTLAATLAEWSIDDPSRVFVTCIWLNEPDAGYRYADL